MAKTSAVLKNLAAGGTSMVKKPATKVGKRPASLGLPVKSKKRKEEEERKGLRKSQRRKLSQRQRRVNQRSNCQKKL